MTVLELLPIVLALAAYVGSHLSKHDLPAESVLFEITGSTADGSAFQREVRRDVEVPVGVTARDTSIRRVSAEKGRVVLSVTPRDKLRHRLGPGWAQRFEACIPSAKACQAVPLEVTDEGDGTYSIELLREKRASLRGVRLSVRGRDLGPLPVDESWWQRLCRWLTPGGAR